MKEFRPDAPIHAETPRHVLDIGANPFAQIGHFIDERDLCRKKPVGRVLDQLRRLAVGAENGDVTKTQGSVELRQTPPRCVARHPEYNPVRAQEILDGGTLAKEFRVGRHIKIPSDDQVRTLGRQDGLDPPCRPNRNRRLGYNQGGAAGIEYAGQLTAGGFQRAEIRVSAVRPPRGPHREKDDSGTAQVGNFAAEVQPLRFDIPLHEPAQAWLEERDFSRAERGKPRIVGLDANDFGTEFREARCGNQSDISRADHGNSHGCCPPRTVPQRLKCRGCGAPPHCG